TIAALGHSRVVDASDIPLRLTARPSTRRLPLEGTWRILVDPPPTGPADSAGWRDIEVPSHWEMKGFRAKGDTAVMRKVFDVPAEWRGKIIKLRADGIYSHCQARLNGVRIGSHDGGATPVELDLTGAARPGRPNTLDLFIRARSPAAEFDHMSVYAYFELAGIWRPIEVFAVDLVHIARLNWAVAFDKSFADADLTVNVTLANAGHGPFQGGPLTVRLLDPSGKPAGEAGAFVSLPAGEEKAAPLRIHVAGPEPWTAERPRLYRLEASFNGEIVESPVGFRQMDVSGKRFTINGRGAKLFGVCLHSADPAAGRAVSAALVEQDLSLIKGCNLNAVRTSHYPPHPHAPEYADRIGLYIEDEGPACWADTDDLRDAPLYMGIYASFVERDRNHPSVVYWSMCNESNYTRVFQMTQKYIKSADPTRPSSGSYAPDIDPADMIVRHHPTNLNLFIRDMGKMPKPVFMDECLSIFHGWGDLAYSL
ncbi:MAG: glycoside hydrolase family 2 TIM barrel-domain containing protein, partial [Candidatus Aminicenantales bacterium]